jgi:hypothetical protein
MFITLTTDFGTASPYVAAMKGVILSINPSAAIFDLSHHIPAQDVRHASYYLAHSVPFFPPGGIHVCVVDPGVGSERAMLCVEVGSHLLLAPDNGCVTGVIERLGGDILARKLTERRFWRATVSDTFHGRDVFAPVAAHLTLGVAPTELGPVASSWLRLAEPAPEYGPRLIRGVVSFVDHFGNLITNIPWSRRPTTPKPVTLGMTPLPNLKWVRTYADAAPGEWIALSSSNGHLEIAIVQGNAAARLGAGPGMQVAVELPEMGQ